MMAQAAQPDGASGAALTSAGLIALRALSRQTGDSRATPTGLPGGFVSRKRGRGQETAEIRAYLPGDDIRHIDRNTTARTGALHVRSFQDERDRTTLLVADFRPSMLWGTRRAFLSVAAAEVLVLLGWRVIDAGGRVGLVAITGAGPIVVPARGRVRGMLDVIGGLVTAHAAALAGAARDLRDPDLTAFLPRVQRIAPTGAQVVLATGLDAPGAGVAAQLAALAARTRLGAVIVTDAVELGLPDGDYPIETPDGARLRAVVRGRPAPDPQRARLAPLEAAGATVCHLDAALPPSAMLDVLERLDHGPQR